MSFPERADVLLSVQRALLGRVTPNLRGVTVGWSSQEIKIRCFFGEEISAVDREQLDYFHTEVIADFPNQEVKLQLIQLESPRAMPSLQAWAYERYEENA